MGEEPKGVIGRAFEDGKPIIYKFVNEMPKEDIRNKLPLLLVVAWKYDGDSNDGMPSDNDIKKMMSLEDTIEKKIEITNTLRHAYSRTGNNLKELVYYVDDEDKFMEMFNIAMHGRERLPIEITFDEDKEWKELAKLLKLHQSRSDNSD